MESTGMPGALQVSAVTHALLPAAVRALWAVRGEIPVKGKGLSEYSVCMYPMSASDRSCMCIQCLPWADGVQQLFYEFCVDTTYRHVHHVAKSCG